MGQGGLGNLVDLGAEIDGDLHPLGDLVRIPAAREPAWKILTAEGGWPRSLAILGALDLPLVVMATRWFRGIHPASPEMEPSMRPRCW